MDLEAGEEKNRNEKRKKRRGKESERKTKLNVTVILANASGYDQGAVLEAFKVGSKKDWISPKDLEQGMATLDGVGNRQISFPLFLLFYVWVRGRWDHRGFFLLCRTVLLYSRPKRIFGNVASQKRVLFRPR